MNRQLWSPFRLFGWITGDVKQLSLELLVLRKVLSQSTMGKKQRGLLSPQAPTRAPLGHNCSCYRQTENLNWSELLASAKLPPKETTIKTFSYLSAPHVSRLLAVRAVEYTRLNSEKSGRRRQPSPSAPGHASTIHKHITTRGKRRQGVVNAND